MGSCQSKNEFVFSLPTASSGGSSSRYHHTSSSHRQMHSEDMDLNITGIVSQRESLEAMERLRRAGWKELMRMPDKFRNDEDIVGMAIEMACITGRGEIDPPLAMATARLRTDRDFVLRAIRVDPTNVQYALPELQNDQSFVVDAIQSDWRAILSLPDIWKCTRITALAAVQQSGRALRYMSEDLRNDRSIVAAAVEQSWVAFPYASETLQKDGTIARCAFFQNGNVFDELDEMVQADIELLALSIRYSDNLEFRWREALQMHKSNLVACVSALLQQENILQHSLRTLGKRRDENSDWEGHAIVEFTKQVWMRALYYKTWLLYQKIGQLGPVHDMILEYSNLQHDAKLAEQIIRFAPLVATMHLRGIVNWRNLPNAFPDVDDFRG